MAKNAPSRGLWVPCDGSLWHKRAGVATLWATHFITIWNKYLTESRELNPEFPESSDLHCCQVRGSWEELQLEERVRGCWHCCWCDPRTAGKGYILETWKYFKSIKTCWWGGGILLGPARATWGGQLIKTKTKHRNISLRASLSHNISERC